MFPDIRTLITAAHRQKRTHKNSVAGSSCGRVFLPYSGFCVICDFGLLCQLPLQTLQGWGGSCRTELCWLSIWWKEAANGTPLLQAKIICIYHTEEPMQRDIILQFEIASTQSSLIKQWQELLFWIKNSWLGAHAYDCAGGFALIICGKDIIRL